MSPSKAWWQQFGLTAILGAAAVAGLAAIGIETEWGRALRPSAAPERRDSAAAELTPTVPAFKLGELDVAYKDSGERPLFTPTRRPPQAIQSAATPQMKRGLFKLAGTVVNAETSVAYLVEIAGNKTHRVNKGAEVLGQPGLIVEAVEPNRVTLKMGEESEVLELRTAASPPRPPAPPAVQTAVPAGVPNPAGAAQSTQPVPVASVPQQASPPAFLPGMGATAGFVSGAPGALPQSAQPGAAAATDANAAAQRRRRFPQTPPANQ
ncbi:MAG: hypothetical protein JNK75_00725 [Betaproteobacteria bacterium]|nr:hypothetical protein [Betaproteobacteria bacterium]